MTAKVFEVALGIATPWSVTAVESGELVKVPTAPVDFERDSQLAVSGHEGACPVHDTVSKRHRDLNFFQH